MSLNTFFAEYVGVALASLGNDNDLVGDGLLNIVVAVSGPQADADLFERDA